MKKKPGWLDWHVREWIMSPNQIAYINQFCALTAARRKAIYPLLDLFDEIAKYAPAQCVDPVGDWMWDFQRLAKLGLTLPELLHYAEWVLNEIDYQNYEDVHRLIREELIGFPYKLSTEQKARVERFCETVSQMGLTVAEIHRNLDIMYAD